MYFDTLNICTALNSTSLFKYFTNTSRLYRLVPAKAMQSFHLTNNKMTDQSTNDSPFSHSIYITRLGFKWLGWNIDTPRQTLQPLVSGGISFS